MCFTKVNGKVNTCIMFIRPRCQEFGAGRGVVVGQERERNFQVKDKLAGYKRPYFYFTRQMSVNVNTHPMALVLWQEIYTWLVWTQAGQKPKQKHIWVKTQEGLNSFSFSYHSQFNLLSQSTDFIKSHSQFLAYTLLKCYKFQLKQLFLFLPDLVSSIKCPLATA